MNSRVNAFVTGRSAGSIEELDGAITQAVFRGTHG
jgi:hypothetical protein